MKKTLKLIATNLLVLMLLLMIIEFVSMIFLDAVTLSKSQKTDAVEIRTSDLPNYDTITWAHDHLEEFTTLETNYKSYYGWRRKEFHGKTVDIDSVGIRKTTSQENERLPSIVFLGGSTMWGTGSNNENTIPSIFAQKHAKNYNVLNYGESAYTAYQSFVFLNTQIAKNQLDSIAVIITYDGVNNSPALKKPFEHFREKNIDDLLQKKKEAALQDREYVFMNATITLVTKIKKRFSQSEVPIANEISENDLKEAAIELLESWLSLKNLADQQNAKFLCILQPNAYVGNPDLKNLRGNFESLLQKTNHARDSYQYYALVKEFLKKDKYKTLEEHFIDMTNTLDGIPNVYIDFCHVSPNGNAIIVSKLIEHLKNNKNSL